MSAILKWAWRHHVLTIDDWFEDLDEAVRSASHASDNGEESVDSIEVIDDDGNRTVYDKKAIWSMIATYELTLDVEQANEPPPDAILDVRGPSGEWASYSSYRTRARAEEAAVEWRARLGDDRVKIRPYGTLTRSWDDLAKEIPS